MSQMSALGPTFSSWADTEQSWVYNYTERQSKAKYTIDNYTKRQSKAVCTIDNYLVHSPLINKRPLSRASVKAIAHLELRLDSFGQGFHKFVIDASLHQDTVGADTSLEGETDAV